MWFFLYKGIKFVFFETRLAILYRRFVIYFETLTFFVLFYFACNYFVVFFVVHSNLSFFIYQKPLLGWNKSGDNLGKKWVLCKYKLFCCRFWVRTLKGLISKHSRTVYTVKAICKMYWYMKWSQRLFVACVRGLQKFG